MLKHNHLIIISLLLFNLAFYYCSAGDGGIDVAANSTHEDLVSLFLEFRDFQEVEILNGVPDYTAAAMDEQKRGLKTFQCRLAAFDIKDWPVSQQVDYHLVRAEMNGLDFFHRVLRPWSRDPLYYMPNQGCSVFRMTGLSRLRRARLPLTSDRLPDFRIILQAVPAIYEQAKENLRDVPEDFANLAIHFIDREASNYHNLAAQLAEYHPELVPDAEQAANAVIDYGKWLEDNKSNMTGPAGIGVENYNWWLKNVHLFPYTWKECMTIVQHECSRIITFLELEENRNRDLPPLEVADTEKEYYRRLDIALNSVVAFLRDEEILTVPDWLNPADYSDPNKPRRPLPTSNTIDHRAREREVLPGETHEFIGHLFDRQRIERDERPIRGAQRLYNMDWIRSEGWAASLEELLMQAGVLDNRPQRGREVEYLMNASHMSLSLPDLKLHNNEINYTEMRKLCAEIMPYKWSDENDRMVWHEMQTNLRSPGFHTGVVVGKAHFTKLLKDRAMQLGEDFVLRDFIDEFLVAGEIPMALTRWEMTGYEDEMKKLLQ